MVLPIHPLSILGFLGVYKLGGSDLSPIFARGVHEILQCRIGYIGYQHLKERSDQIRFLKFPLRQNAAQKEARRPHGKAGGGGTIRDGGQFAFLAIFNIFLNTNYCELLFMETLSPPGDKALLAALVDQGADHDPSHQAGQGRLRWGRVRR